MDRIVLNAYYPLGHNPGGFHTWWRRLYGDDAQLDNAHLLRMAGRSARRGPYIGAAHRIPVIHCKRGERKHEIAEEYLASHRVDRGARHQPSGAAATVIASLVERPTGR